MSQKIFDELVCPQLILRMGLVVLKRMINGRKKNNEIQLFLGTLKLHLYDYSNRTLIFIPIFYQQKDVYKNSVFRLEYFDFFKLAIFNFDVDF